MPAGYLPGLCCALTCITRVTRWAFGSRTPRHERTPRNDHCWHRENTEQRTTEQTVSGALVSNNQFVLCSVFVCSSYISGDPACGGG